MIHMPSRCTCLHSTPVIIVHKSSCVIYILHTSIHGIPVAHHNANGISHCFRRFFELSVVLFAKHHVQSSLSLSLLAASTSSLASAAASERRHHQYHYQQQHSSIIIISIIIIISSSIPASSSTAAASAHHHQHHLIASLWVFSPHCRSRSPHARTPRWRMPGGATLGA